MMLKGSFVLIAVFLILSVFATYRKTIKISNKKERGEIRNYITSSMILSLIVLLYSIVNLMGN